MKKRLFAGLLTLVMIVSLVPMPALAVEDDTVVVPCTKTEGCILADGHEGGCVLSDEPEDGDSNGYYEFEDVTDGEGGIMLLAEGDTTQPKDGTCGASGSETDVTWKLEQNNQDSDNPTYTLTISGTGAMKDWTYGNWAPWCQDDTIKTQINKVVIEDGVENIGAWAFKNCKNLSTVTIPNSVVTFGDSCFETTGLSGNFTFSKNVEKVGINLFYSTQVSNFSIDDGNEYYSVKDGILYNFDGKTLVSCPPAKEAEFNNDWLSGVYTLGEYAFRNCQKLTGTLTIPETITEIPTGAFYNCTGLTGNLVIPDTVKGKIGNNAFRGSGFNGSLSIGSGVTSIGDYAFTSTKFTSIQDLGINLEQFGTQSFEAMYQCGGDIVIPDKVTEIPDKTFHRLPKNVTATSIGTIHIGSCVQKIGNYAFYGWAFTGTIVFPQSVISMGTSSFSHSASREVVFPYKIETIQGITLYHAANDWTYHLYPSTVTHPNVNNGGAKYAGAYTLASGDKLNVPIGSSIDMMTFAGTGSYTLDISLQNMINKIAYQSSAESVATVSDEGNITAVGNAGDTATITALYNGTPFAKVEITVAAKSVNVTMSNSTVTYDGDTKTIQATAAGEDEELPDDLTLVYNYKESNADDGTYTKIPPTAPGTYTVKVESGNPNYTLSGTATATLTISAPSSKTDVSENDVVVAPTSLVYDGSAKSYAASYEGISEWSIVYYDSDGAKLDSAPVNAGGYTVTINGAGESSYASIMKEFSITPASLTITADNKSIYVGDALPEYTYTVSGLAEKDTESVITIKPTMTCSAADANTANTYTITASGANAGENYTITYVDGTLTVFRRSSGGGGGGTTTYTVTVDSAKNGTVTVSPKNASKGTTVTVTVKPNSGYELDDLTVTDKNGDTVKLARKSDTQYTFTMPAGKVTVEASFAKIEEQPSVTFIDVPTSAYYYDAVEWAVENGVTNGTSATTFSPDNTVTRGQTVTFLHRYAGSPTASGGSFADVAADAYYAPAVQWAVANGITNGTSSTTFSPDAPCTRGQIVTFLYRAAA